MSDKKKELASDVFQLNAKDFHTKNPVLNMAINALVDAVNKFDANKDGKSDIGQLAPIAQKLLPVVLAVGPLVDWSKVWSFVVNSFVKSEDRPQFLSLVGEGQKHVDEALTITVHPTA